MYICNNNIFDKNMKYILLINMFYYYRFMCLKDYNIIIIFLYDYMQKYCIIYINKYFKNGYYMY